MAKEKKFIPVEERRLAALYFTLSNVAMLNMFGGSLENQYYKADETMSFECGASIAPELADWTKSVNEGDAYCYEEWQKVREKYLPIKA